MIKYLVLSDLHLGHRRTPTEHIVRNLDALFLDKRLSGLDMIFIPGDVFDRLLDNTTQDLTHIHRWFGRLLRYCAKHNIILRIVEGTPSHDWQQSSFLETAKDILCDMPVDAEYIKILSIEHIKKHDLHILYIPDEWHESPAVTFIQVKELMAAEGIAKIDIAFMHGQFNYQIPTAGGNVPKHDEASYLGITTFFIHIGHVHGHSIYERIMAQGSFDRLKHGEEEPKGCMLFTIDKSTRESAYHFIENVNAKPYITIKLTHARKNWLEYIDNRILSLPEDSFVRIELPKDHEAANIFADIKMRYPQYNLSKKIKGEEELEAEKNVMTYIQIDTTLSSINLSAENLPSLILDALDNKGIKLSDDENRIFEQLMAL